MFMDWKSKYYRQYCKIVILPKFICKFSAVPIRIPAGPFVAVDKPADSQPYMETQRVNNREDHFEEEQTWKICSKTTITVMLVQGKTMEQWKRIEYHGINSRI